MDKLKLKEGLKLNLESTYEILVGTINATEPTSERYYKAQTILEAKIMLESAMYSKKLNRATWILAFATIGLLVATIGLFFKGLFINPCI